MQKLIKIDNIMFYVKDLDKSINFYSNILGLEQIWKDEKNKMVGFVFPNTKQEIVIHSNPSISNPDFSFLVSDVEDFVKNYKENGFNVIKEPFNVRCGRFAILADLDGNVINIIDFSLKEN
ncbi:MAG: VOC family protein [Candidatus Paceibacterota bacterium]|jgi:predicted enzyme related to lactoylglutathione lyase